MLASMVGALRHRGPDDRGEEQGRGWGLGFSRLSILDLSPLGHQPMSTDDGRFWLVFNGEIYNYVELRCGLEQQGERFRSGSDTEVLLRLLARRGAGALPMLNGMFALALVDTQQETFLLARDRLGVKPLYFRADREGLRFASELKALVCSPGDPKSPDPAAIARYLALGYLPSETCVFRGYSKLPPGHYMSGNVHDPGAARIARYWHLPSLSDEARAASPTEFEALSDLLQDAVRIRLRSDVPVGVFLSGGIDSGLVASLAARVADRPLLALTVGFREGHANETEQARQTAQHAGLEHLVIEQEPSGLGDLDRLAHVYDEPFGDASALPTLRLCDVAARHAKVFLSGDGGDEAFGGYRRYIECRRHERLIGLASRLSPALRSVARFLPGLSLTRYRLMKLSSPGHGAAAAFDEHPGDPALHHIVHGDLRPYLGEVDSPVWERWAQSRGASLLGRQQRLDYELYLPDDVLVKVDRASMACSIEVRSPFLDFRIIELAARLPRSALLNALHGKLPLRALSERHLPRPVQAGAKHGFGVPLGDWFRQPAGHALLRERLLGRTSAHLAYWDRRATEKLIELHYSGRGRDFGALLWRLLMLEAWTRAYAGDGSTGTEVSPVPASRAAHRRVPTAIPRALSHTGRA